MKLLPLLSFTIVVLGFAVAGNCESPAETVDEETEAVQTQTRTMKLGIVGLVHTHVHGLLGRPDSDDIEIVGIVEPNRKLAEQYSRQHGFAMDIVFDSIDEMVKASKPEAVAAFNPIYDHLEVVQYCAPRGIHVMVEKPMAVSLDHARQMYDLAKKHKIHLLTNYETSWYPTPRETFRIINQETQFSKIKKINFYTGHQGPIEIGCNPEFVEWLIDPKLNGGGALTDFGCYGANIATWMLNGERPVSVACVTQQTKPDLYPNVEDDATIILNYSETQVLIQASWNWSHSRKEMELFGTGGYIKCLNGNETSVMLDEKAGPRPRSVDGKNQLLDPFSLFQQVVSGDHKLKPNDLSALENNLIVVEILEAAKIAAKENRLVMMEDLSE